MKYFPGNGHIKNVVNRMIDEKKVLIVCTHNAVRSQMSEAVINRDMEGWRAVSAGSDPRSPNPLVLELLDAEGYDVRGMRSKHIDEVLDDSVDMVIFVCGEADSCVHLNVPVPRVRFPLPDPVALADNDDDRRRGLEDLLHRIRSELPGILR